MRLGTQPYVSCLWQYIFNHFLLGIKMMRLNVLNGSDRVTARLEWSELMLMTVNLPWLYVSYMPPSVCIKSCWLQSNRRTQINVEDLAVLPRHHMKRLSPDVFFSQTQHNNLPPSSITRQSGASISHANHYSHPNPVAFWSAVGNCRDSSRNKMIKYSYCMRRPVKVEGGYKPLRHWVTRTIQHPSGKLDWLKGNNLSMYERRAHTSGSDSALKVLAGIKNNAAKAGAAP